MQSDTHTRTTQANKDLYGLVPYMCTTYCLRGNGCTPKVVVPRLVSIAYDVGGGRSGVGHVIGHGIVS